MFIIENDIPANRGKGRIRLADMYLESDNFSYVMYIFTRHGHRLDARDLIEYPWSVLKLSVSLIMNHPTGGNTTETLANRLDSDQARNFVKVSNCLKLCCMYT